MPQPIGILGGTFDPIHFGHLRTALELKEALGWSEVRWIPASVPPHRGVPAAGPAARLAMVRAAVAGESSFTVDERELNRPGPSYMVDTLASLREEFGETPLCLILGLDAFLGLPHWHEWRQIPQLAHLVVAHRPGWRVEQAAGAERAAVALLERRTDPVALSASPAGAVVLQAVTPLAISATEIRRTIAAGRSPRYLLPDPVWDIIEKQNLYRRTED